MFLATAGYLTGYAIESMGLTPELGVLAGTAAATLLGLIVGFFAIRRQGIYFAMVTLALAQLVYFVYLQAPFTGGEDGLQGVPRGKLFGLLDLTSDLALYYVLVVAVVLAFLLIVRIVHSPFGQVLTAIRENEPRAISLGYDTDRFKLLAFVLSAGIAGLAGSLKVLVLGFETLGDAYWTMSGLVILMTLVGGMGTLFGPLLGAAVWLFLQDFLQAALGLGAAWKLVLGVVFVLLVCFLRRGLIGGIGDLYKLVFGKKAVEPVEDSPQSGLTAIEEQAAAEAAVEKEPDAAPMPPHRRAPEGYSGPILQAKGLTKHYGGIAANSDIDFTVNYGELRGIIGPNGAGKSTFFKMLTCEVAPTSGQIIFEGHDITGKSVTDVCQLGLTKSYQVNQLFTHLTVRENVEVAALAEIRGKFKLDLFRNPNSIPGLNEQVDHTLAMVNLTRRANTPVSELAYGEKRRLEIGLALANSPSLLLLDEPLAGMSPRERVETVKLLKSISKGRTMIIIDHDMDSLFELVEHVTVLQEGRVLVEGTPEQIKSNAVVQEAYLGGVMEK